jgi:hypothetical protein
LRVRREPAGAGLLYIHRALFGKQRESSGKVPDAHWCSFGMVERIDLHERGDVPSDATSPLSRSISTDTAEIGPVDATG